MKIKEPKEPITIVLAWTIEEYVCDGRPYAADLGQRPHMRPVVRGRAAMWCRRGTSEDVKKARESASALVDAERVHVFVYPAHERFPLERARRDVLALER